MFDISLWYASVLTSLHLNCMCKFAYSWRECSFFTKDGNRTTNDESFFRSCSVVSVSFAVFCVSNVCLVEASYIQTFPCYEIKKIFVIYRATLTSKSLHLIFYFYIHGSVHRDSVLIRSNEMQQHVGVYVLQVYSNMFRASIVPIIRSTINSSCSLWYMS